MLKEDEKLDLVEHLAELRIRIIRAIIYIVVGFAAGWALYPQIYRLLMAPLAKPISDAGGNGIGLLRASWLVLPSLSITRWDCNLPFMHYAAMSTFSICLASKNGKSLE